MEFDDKTTSLQLAFDPTDDEGAFTVTVVSGPDEGAHITVDASQPSVLVGQSPACDLRLSDRAVSRRHARLTVCERRVRLTDLESKNGTYIGKLGIGGSGMGNSGVGPLGGGGADVGEPSVGELRVGDVWLTQGMVRMGATTLRIALATGHVTRRLGTAAKFGELIGGSTEMRRLHPLCQRLAKVDLPVLIEGETGTGKEVLAEALHALGPRAKQPYVVFDCTAVPPTMVEAALFGHERGSFTGAVTSRSGVFERAHGGTLLIDEIGDLDLSLQPKLLRVVERGEVQRIGGEQVKRVDVRLLAATRRNLDREVQAGRFRDDLFHRLAVARVELPPLRERRGDVPLLVRHFCAQLAADPRSVPTTLLQQWQDAPWPGNVRELKNAVLRFVALGDLEEQGLAPFAVEMSPEASASASASLDWLDRMLDPQLPLAKARQRVLEEFERRYIARVLAAHDGSVKDAAKTAGVAKRYFQLLKARVAQKG